MTESSLLIIGMVVFFIAGAATFLFGRVTVKHIESEMAKEGILPPVWDKGIGVRLPAYAHIIIFPNIDRHASLVDIKATKRYARKKDRYLAIFMECSCAAFISVICIYSYLY